MTVPHRPAKDRFRSRPGLPTKPAVARQVIAELQTLEQKWLEAVKMAEAIRDEPCRCNGEDLCASCIVKESEV